MRFPDLGRVKEKIINTLAEKENRSPADIQVVASPYRICPLGAHIDHQGGPVLGMTIDAYALLAFIPVEEPAINLVSHNYPGLVAFGLDQVPKSIEHYWGQYVRAAVLALKERFPLRIGITGIVDGMLPGCGLSSSASVLLAYLYALTAANQIELEPWDYVRFTQKAENKYMGLNNGILDQTSIVFGQKNHLLYIDTRQETAAPIPARSEWTGYQILIAYSGYSRELTTTRFNTRVEECVQAAKTFAMLSNLVSGEQLADVPTDVFLRYHHRLPTHLARRAKHFFGEVKRVEKGVDAWKQGQINRIGQLMVETCQSSIDLYECGIPAICDLQDIVRLTAGMAGSRFMGGGYGGCVVGFVDNEHAAKAADSIQASYRKRHPEVADQAIVYLTQSADGIRFL